MTDGPDFLCVGAQKAATSWLFVMLRSVEGVFLPEIKESNYFIERTLPAGGWARQYRLSEVEKEKAFLATGGPVLRPTRALKDQLDHLGAAHVDDDWYRGVFAFAPRGAVRGEICPSYMHMRTDSIRHAMGINPEMRVLLIVRDPVDRLWSQLRMETRAGVIEMDLDRLLRDRSAMRHYLDFTDYAGSIERWGACAGGGRLRLMVYDRILADPEGALRSVLGFIGAAGPGMPGGLRVRVNRGQAADLQPGHRERLLEMLGDQYAYLERRFPCEVKQWLRRHHDAIGRGVPQI